MIEQAKEAYTWAALYIDGSYIAEYEPSCPNGRGFAEVDATRVKQLRIASDDLHLRSHYVEVPEGATPVFFRRRSIALQPVDGQTTTLPTVHCIGWKHDDKAVYLFISDNGNTLLTDNLQAV
jgi:hypothetical protein